MSQPNDETCETLEKPGFLRRTGESERGQIAHSERGQIADSERGQIADSERGQIADSERGQIADSEIFAIKLWSIYMHAPVVIPCVCPKSNTHACIPELCGLDYQFLWGVLLYMLDCWIKLVPLYNFGHILCIIN